MAPVITQRGFPAWSSNPIKNLSLSSSGILALADLTTTAKRTAITGTSIWLDTAVLVPGLHIQQAAETIGTTNKGGVPSITSNSDGDISRVTNTATIHYLHRIYDNDNGGRRAITVDVGSDSWRGGSSGRRAVGPRGKILRYENPPTSRVSAFLYSLAPLCTVIATILMILAQDWWGLATILWLMIARALNVYVIRRRTADEPPVSGRNRHVCWWVNLDDDRWICLRGLRHDLQAITTGSWMREKTHIQGYMEATAKIIVFLVAVFSGNLTQTGDIILMALLLASGALLAMSNAYARTFHMNGRTACHHGPAERKDTDSTHSQRGDEVPPYSEGGGSGNGSGVISDFEKREAQIVLASAYPFNDEVQYV